MLKLKKAYVNDDRMSELQYICYGDYTPHMCDTKVYRYWASPLKTDPKQCRILRVPLEYVVKLKTAPPEFWQEHVREIVSNRKRGK